MQGEHQGNIKDNEGGDKGKQWKYKGSTKEISMEHQGERRVSEGKQRETKQVQGETKGNEVITKGIPRKHLGNFGKLCSFRLKGFRLKRLFGSGTFSHSGIFRPDRTHKSILSRKNLEPNTFSERELVWLGKEEIFCGRAVPSGLF